MPFGSDLQTIDACIGITTCFIKVCAFVKRYRSTDKTVEQVESVVEEVRSVLEEARAALDKRAQRTTKRSFQIQDERRWARVLTPIQRCESTLKDLMRSVCGELVQDERSLLDKHIARAKIAFDPQKIAGPKNELLFHLSSLHITLHSIQL